jgi:hypothetical protein
LLSIFSYSISFLFLMIFSSISFTRFLILVVIIPISSYFSLFNLSRMLFSFFSNSSNIYYQRSRKFFISFSCILYTSKCYTSLAFSMFLSRSPFIRYFISRILRSKRTTLPYWRRSTSLALAPINLFLSYQHIAYSNSCICTTDMLHSPASRKQLPSSSPHRCLVGCRLLEVWWRVSDSEEMVLKA